MQDFIIYIVVKIVWIWNLLKVDLRYACPVASLSIIFIPLLKSYYEKAIPCTKISDQLSSYINWSYFSKRKLNKFELFGKAQKSDIKLNLKNLKILNKKVLKKNSEIV